VNALMDNQHQIMVLKCLPLGFNTNQILAFGGYIKVGDFLYTQVITVAL